MAINPLLQGLVANANTAKATTQINSQVKAKNALGGLTQVVKKTMPKARAKALLPGLVNNVIDPINKKILDTRSKAKALLPGLTNTAIESANVVKGQAQEKQTNAIGELGATVLENPNVEPSKLRQAFPEFSNLNDDILGELGATVLENPNVTTEQLRQAFPELDPTYKSQSGGTALDFFEGFGSQIPQLAQKASEKVVNPLRKLAGKRELSQEELVAMRPDQYLGVGDRNTTAGKVGGQVYNAALGTAGSIIAAPLTAGAGLLTRTAVGAGEGIAQANLNTLLDRGELATGTENIVGGTLGGVLGGVANVKRVKPTSKVTELIQPKMTPSVEAERAAQGLKTTNIFGGVGMKATGQEKKMVEVAKQIGLNPSKTVTSNVNKTISSLNKETDKLIDIVKDQPYTFTTKDVVSRMNNIEKPISLRGTDLEKQYNAVKKVFSDMIDAEPNKNASTLLKIRKDFDALISKEFPNLYKSDTLTPLKIAITKLRKIPNEMLNETIGDDIVKQSLSKQSLMIDMIDNMAGKTEKTGTNALSRRAGRNKGKVGTAGALGTAALLNQLGVKVPGLSGGGAASPYTE